VAGGGSGRGAPAPHAEGNVNTADVAARAPTKRATTTSPAASYFAFLLTSQIRFAALLSPTSFTCPSAKPM